MSITQDATRTVIAAAQAVLGAVGVSGATPDEDRACAEADRTALGG